MRVWEVCGSLDEGVGSKRRFTVMVSAKEARDVIKATERAYPKLFIWSVVNKGPVEFLNADEKHDSEKPKPRIEHQIILKKDVSSGDDTMEDVEEFTG